MAVTQLSRALLLAVTLSAPLAFACELHDEPAAASQKQAKPAAKPVAAKAKAEPAERGREASASNKAATAEKRG